MGDTSEINEDITSIHRRERKELQAKIQSLKKSASKGDKKKRKEVLEEIAKLEIDIEKKQFNELNCIDNAKCIEKTAIPTENKEIACTIQDQTVSDESTKGSSENHSQRISKAQKRRDKKALKDRERELKIIAQEELNKDGPRMNEIRSIKTILKERKLLLHTIPSDGDCLYNAVCHQLKVTNRREFDVSHLRNETAEYIKNNKSDLIVYMTNPTTGDTLSDEDFIDYCEMVRTTPAWGGQIEIKALSSILKVPIEIIQASGPPTVQDDNEYPKPNLILTYHRLMYSLGEHYNSTKPQACDEDVDDDDLEQ